MTRRVATTVRPGFTRVYKLVTGDEPDALRWVQDWYALRGWAVQEDGATYTTQGKNVMVAAWAKIPEKEEA